MNRAQIISEDLDCTINIYGQSSGETTIEIGQHNLIFVATFKFSRKTHWPVVYFMTKAWLKEGWVKLNMVIHIYNLSTW
jgi:hypothetical protein